MRPAPGWALLAGCAAVALLAGGCGKQRHVVVFTSVDRNWAEGFLRDFEAKTKIKVDTVYDTEAGKTTGLAARLAERRDNPEADVFWNSEIGRTIGLANQGVLEPFTSPSAGDIPAYLKDPGGTWVGFAARARVIVYNTELVAEDEAPRRLEDLLDQRFRAKVAIADPRFGTTALHMAALFEVWGTKRTQALLQGLAANGVQVVLGNSVVRDRVGRGEVLVGLTDTDDVLSGQAQGMPIAMVVPDQGPKESGTLVVPNTVCRIKGGPHPKEAQAFLDYLLSRETEAALCAPGSGFMVVRGSAPASSPPAGEGAAGGQVRPPVPPEGLALAGIRAMQVGYAGAATHLTADAERAERLLRGPQRGHPSEEGLPPRPLRRLP